MNRVRNQTPKFSAILKRRRWACKLLTNRFPIDTLSRICRNRRNARIESSERNEVPACGASSAVVRNLGKQPVHAVKVRNVSDATVGDKVSLVPNPDPAILSACGQCAVRKIPSPRPNLKDAPAGSWSITFCQF